MNPQTGLMPGQGPQQPQQQGSGGNWFTHLLPTAGGILGGLVGSVGDLAGPVGVATTVGGATAGGALGQSLENDLEGKKVIQGNDVTSGLENGVGDLVGLGAGKAIGAGADLLGKRATSLIGDQASQDASKAAVDNAQNLKNAYADVSPGLQKAYDAEGQKNLVTSFGLDPTNPEHLLQTSSNANDVLNSNLNDVLSNSGTRDLSDYNDIVKKAVGESDNTLGSSDPTALKKGQLGPSNSLASKLVQQLQQQGMGTVNATSDPIQVRGLISRLQGLAADAKPGVSAITGAKDPDQVAAYNSINDVVGQLKDRLYNNDVVKQGVSGLQGNLQASDVGGSQELADHLNNILSSAKEGQDLLTPMSNFTNMSKLGNELQNAQKIVGSPAALARAKVEAGAGLPEANTNPVSSAKSFHSIVTGDGGTVSKALQLAGHSVNNAPLLNTLSRMGKLTASVAPTAGVMAANAPNLGAAPVASPTAAISPEGGTMGAMNPQAMQQPQMPLNQVYGTLLAQEQAAPTVLGPQLAGVLGTLAPQLQKNQLASSELSALPASFANAGGAQGTGGILSRISGLVPGTAANTYDQQQQAAANSIANALGITPQAAMGLLPQLMQNQQSAGINQGVLGQLTGQLAY